MRSRKKSKAAVTHSPVAPKRPFLQAICASAAVYWSGLSQRCRTVLFLLALLGGLSAWLLPVSVGRLIDGDEGYLLMAARLVSEGQVPYRDFFLPQGPLLPAFFGVYFWGLGRSWLGARLLAGAIAIAMGWLVYRESLAATRRQTAALFATALFAFSGASIGWLTIVKGYGLSALWVLASLPLIGSVVREPTPPIEGRHTSLAVAGVGVLMGLAASTRLYALLLMPTLAVYLVARLGRNRLTVRRLGYFALGCFFGLLPLSVSCAVDSKAFLFDTIHFHAVREFGQDSLLGSATEKMPAFLRALGLHPEASLGGRQLMGLAIVAMMALLFRIRPRNTYGSAAACVWPVLLVASALPNPFHAQYLCMLVPFLAIEGGILLAVLLDICHQQRNHLRSLGVAVCALIYLSYHLGVGWLERDRYLHTGEGVPGVWSSDRVSKWQIENVESAAKAIDSLYIPVAASWWPGYFVSTRTSIIPALANDFGLRAADVLSPEERRRLHIASLAEVGEMIRQHNPRLFVEGNWAASPWVTWLPQYGYQIRRTGPDVRLWTVE